MEYLAYIGSSGSQYIDTNIYLNGQCTVEIKGRINQATTNWDTFFGCRNGSAARFTYRFENLVSGTPSAQKSASPSDNYVGINSSIAKDSDGMSWHIYKVGSEYVEDGVSKGTYPAGTTSAFPYTLFLFANNNAGTAGDFAYIDVAYCKIWDENNDLIMSLVPVKDDNDVVCMYDNVSGSYYYNQGTGSFIAGYKPRPRKYEYIQSSGTQWLDTGIKPSTTTLIKVGVNVTEATGGVIVGHCNSDNSDYRIFNYQQTAYFDYGSSRISGSRINVNTYYDIEMGNYYLELNGTRVLSGSTVTGSGDYQNHNILTGYSPAESVRTKMKLYYLQIYNNGNLVFDAFPAKDENDVVCLYDKVNSTYIYNQGTGDYTAGPEVVTKTFLIESGGDYYTISGGSLVNVGSTLNAQLFEDYGLNTAPDWSDYSSLANPSVLCWDEFSARSMTATTTGIPGAMVAVSQKVPTGSGIQAVTINSDNDTLYSVSFDDGANWWKYANGAWTQVSAITDGMTKAEVEAISASAWGEKNTGFARFRFTLLDGNGYMTSIRVDYAGGGGDSVEWTQIQSTGTKIAEININGTTQDVYAPDGGSTYTEGDGINISAQNEISVDTTFTEASTRANIDSGDTLSTIFGKIKKWFTDLASMFVSKTGDTMSGNLTIDRQDGTAETDGFSQINLGNNLGSGNVGNSYGRLRIYSKNGYYAYLQSATNLSNNRTIRLPNANGTIALIDVNNNFSANQTIDRADGTTATDGESTFYVGNGTASGTTGNSRGKVRVYSNSDKYVDLRASDNQASNRAIYLPDKAGTLVVESDLAIPINNGTSIALSDFMSIASGITISDSDIRILNNHVSVLLVASGGVSVGANGTFGLGTIKSAYRPSRQAECAAVINRSTSGQVYVPATVDINYTNGYARVICPDNNVNYGNATYPWSTSNGFWFDYWL